MSVYEFILAYWDWWLACGFIFSAAYLADNKTTIGLIGVLVFTLLPPTYVLFHIQCMIRRKS